MPTSTSGLPAVAAFDFDGTITRHDTLWLFLRYAFGWHRLIAGVAMCSPRLAAYALHLADGGATKERLLAHFLRGMPEQQFRQLGRDFAATVAPHEIRPAARAAIEAHLAAGHRVVVVTASVYQWVAPFIAQWPDIDVVATEMTVDNNGLLTGRFATPNCYGEQKWQRLKALIPDVDTRHLIAYGDSKGDNALLTRAQEPHYRQL